MTNTHVSRFNLAAQQYTTDRYPGRSQCMQKVLELLEPQSEDIILDVGCGPGAQLIGLAPSIRAGYGIDPAEEMIRQAEQAAALNSNIHFYVGSAEELPREILEAGINKIFSNYALHHLPDHLKRSSINNLASLLPVHGRLVLGDLMFSDNPDKHKALFGVVGYGPGCDTPADLALLEDMFVEAGLATRICVLNPLVAVIVGEKTESGLVFSNERPQW